MKLASYNVENLFERARALNQQNESVGNAAMQTEQRLNKLFAKTAYSAADKQAIVDLLGKLDLLKDDNGGEYALLRQNRGKLLTRHNDGSVTVDAKGRSDWIGWVELRTEAVNEIATRATAHVIRDVDADVLALIEVESRPSVLRFSEQVMTPSTYEHIMLIDGNDERGIDVGILTKGNYPITGMLSHVDDKDADGLIFSRDCAVYAIKTPKGHAVYVLVNHFKSQRFGDAATDAKRLRQSTRVKAIYEGLVQAGHKFVAVVGDLNVEPTSNTLAPLLAGTDLKDIGAHPAFDDGGGAHAPRPGTFKTGTAHDKLDYILLSPAMWAKTKGGGVFRKGVYTTLFEHYPEITKGAEAASDHSPIWAEIDV